jgi:hypothetical protein
VAVVAEQHEEGAEEEEGRKWWRTWKLWAALLLLLLIGMGAAAGIVFGEQWLVGAEIMAAAALVQKPCWTLAPGARPEDVGWRQTIPLGSGTHGRQSSPYNKCGVQLRLCWHAVLSCHHGILLLMLLLRSCLPADMLTCRHT